MKPYLGAYYELHNGTGYLSLKRAWFRDRESFTECLAWWNSDSSRAVAHGSRPVWLCFEAPVTGAEIDESEDMTEAVVEHLRKYPMVHYPTRYMTIIRHCWEEGAK